MSLYCLLFFSSSVCHITQIGFACPILEHIILLNELSLDMMMMLIKLEQFGYYHRLSITTNWWLCVEMGFTTMQGTNYVFLQLKDLFSFLFPFPNPSLFHFIYVTTTWCQYNLHWSVSNPFTSQEKHQNMTLARFGIKIKQYFH